MTFQSVSLELKNEADVQSLLTSEDKDFPSDFFTHKEQGSDDKNYCTGLTDGHVFFIGLVLLF